MNLTSRSLPTVSTAVSPSRAALDHLVEPLRRQVAPEDARILDLLVALAANATAADAVPKPETRSHEPPLAAILSVTSWDPVRITVVDGHTVRVGSGKRAVLRTYRDLGLYGGHSRMPTRKWDLLVAICQGHGTFRWRDFGGFHAVSQAMSVLRARLKEAFGLAEDPFCAWDGAWKAKFFASSEIAED